MTWEIFQPEENRQPYTPTGMSLDAYKGGFKRDSPKKRDLNIWKHTPQKDQMSLKETVIYFHGGKDQNVI